MIKILQVMAALDAGGVETLLHSCCECMDREQFHSDVACYYHADGVYRAKYEELGCQIIALPSKKKLPQSIRTLYRALKDGRYDIMHVHQDDLSFLPILVARMAGVKVRIVHAHQGKYPHSLPGRMISAVTTPLLFRLANGYFACSEKVKKEFYPERLQGKVFILRNGIRADKFRFSPEYRKAVRAELGFADGQTVIGNIARMTDEKNPLFLIDVFQKLHEADENCRLLMVGDGNLREQIEEKLRTLGLREAAVLTGARNDAYRYYSALDVFVLPSDHEGLGISFLEAQVNGLPAFASDAVPRETKISGRIQYLPVSDGAEAWTRTIRECGGRQEGPEADIRRFDIRESAKELEKAYLQLTEEHRR